MSNKIKNFLKLTWLFFFFCSLATAQEGTTSRENPFDTRMKLFKFRVNGIKEEERC